MHALRMHAFGIGISNPRSSIEVFVHGFSPHPFQRNPFGKIPLLRRLPLGHKYVRKNPEMVYFLIFLRPIESKNKNQSLVCVLTDQFSNNPFGL